MLFIAITAVVSAISGATASQLDINNWCGYNVYVYQSHNGACDSGPNGDCYNQGGSPWVIGPGSGNSTSTFSLGWIQDGEGTSVKIFTDAADYPNAGILQFEYTFSDWFYWDVSNLDGGGAGLVGSPFTSENVKFTPTGDTSGGNKCSTIRCPANVVCDDAYQHPGDPDTRTCPTDTGDFLIDLCEPDPLFSSKKRGLKALKFRA